MSQLERNRLDIVYTIRGEPLLQCFIASTSEGFLFGISHPALGDVHLTVFFRDGKIRTHIKDSNRDPAYVHDRTFTPDILGGQIEARLRRFVKPYSPNMVAWVMRPAFKRRLMAALDFPVQGGVVEAPWEVVQGYVMVDLRSKRRWRRVRIRDLLKTPGELAVRIEGGRLYLIRPLDDRRMLKFTEGQAKALERLLLDYLGFGEYRNYVKAKLAEGTSSSPRPDSQGLGGLHRGESTLEAGIASPRAAVPRKTQTASSSPGGVSLPRRGRSVPLSRHSMPPRGGSVLGRPSANSLP